MIYFAATSGSNQNDGSITKPWQTLEYAVDMLNAGDILYIRGGDYVLTEAIVFKKSGTPSRPITISGYPGEDAVINADNINFFKESDKYEHGTETGALFIKNQSYIHVRNVKVMNSHGHGIAVRDSNNITIDTCITENTFACGISLWDTYSTSEICHHNKIIGNTVIKATTWDMLPEGKKRGNEPPHEAISVAGACYFEVCFNHVYNCDKEGIDVKENAHHGIVHHNHVHHVDRQGLYADAWFGPLEHVEFYENEVHDCRGAGIVISVEQGHCVGNVKVYNNHVYDNKGTGILFGTWGADGPRYNIDIFNNVIKGNGCGAPTPGYDYFWITGGLCMLSANISKCNIHNNIFSGNYGFDIGYNQTFLKDDQDINAILQKKHIKIYDNLILENNNKFSYPVKTVFENSVIYEYTNVI